MIWSDENERKWPENKIHFSINSIMVLGLKITSTRYQAKIAIMLSMPLTGDFQHAESEFEIRFAL